MEAGINTISESRKENWFLKYLHKFKGQKRTTALVAPPPIDIIITFIGAFLGISFLSILFFVYHAPLLVAPMGASAVLIYGVPDAPLAQPRNVILGHTFSAIIGVITYHLFGISWWSVTLGTSLALIVMMLTKTTHPPGGATALFAILSAAGPMYIFAPILMGSIIMVLFGVIVNNLSPNRSYPRYWF